MAIRADLEVRDLRLIAALFSKKTTTAAAQVLGVTQSAVSHQLKNLEGRLDQEVFLRRGRRLVITDAGERLLALAQDLLPRIASVEFELEAKERLPRKKLRVATECYTAYHWLPRAITVLAKHHPEVELTLVPEFTVDPKKALETGQLDLALCIAPQGDARYCQRSILVDEMVLVTAPGHPLTKRPYVTGKDLKNEHLVIYDNAAAQRSSIRQALFPTGGGAKQITRLPLTEAICEMVRANLGVSILANWSVAPLQKRGELSCLRLTRHGIKRKWVGVYPRNTELSQPIRTLLRVLAELGTDRAPGN